MFIYRRFIPTFPLNQLIDFLWYYEGYTPVYSKEKLLPDGTIEIVINLQEEPRRLYDRQDFEKATLYKQSWVSGERKEYIIIESGFQSSMMGIHFKPGGAYPFFAFPISEITDRVEELDLLWGSFIQSARQQILDTIGIEAKFKALEKCLLLQIKQDFAINPCIAYAVGQIIREPQNITLENLSRKIGFSQKHFISLFDRWVGLNPKAFVRICKFQKVLQLIEQNQSINWAEIVFACGYYDQAHFIKEFQAFSGINPSAYLRQKGDFLNYIPIV